MYVCACACTWKRKWWSTTAWLRAKQLQSIDVLSLLPVRSLNCLSVWPESFELPPSCTHTHAHTSIRLWAHTLTQTYSSWPFYRHLLQGQILTPLSSLHTVYKKQRLANISHTKDSAHILYSEDRNCSWDIIAGHFQDAVKRDNEKRRKSSRRRNLKQWKSPVFLHTLMYWLEPTFLLNDFGKPFKKHIKSLCSAWAQLLLCFLPFSPDFCLLLSASRQIIWCYGKICTG